MNTDAIDASYSESIADVQKRFGVTVDSGLDSAEADRRLRKSGRNSLEFRTTRSNWRVLLAQFSSIIIWLLAVAALVSVLTGSTSEAVAIVIVLILNAIVGFVIEWQAGRALDALRQATRTTARVRRDDCERVIDAEELVTGDVVLLASGENVPADARLIEAVRLRTDESTLTGESQPVKKGVEAIVASAPLADRSSMVFLGTTIVGGRAVALVVATGTQTEIGRIGQLLQNAEEKQTPLERRLGELGQRLVYLVLGISVVVFLSGFLRGDDLWLMAKVSISLAVAAVPEGLPAVTTLILALGVLRMARSSAIVRHLVAVETLGSTTVICTDKTGTLTENRMTVREIFVSDGRTILPASEILRSASECREHHDPLRKLLRVAVICNDAALVENDNSFTGDPTETALLARANALGVDIADLRQTNKKISEVPFDPSTKKMSVDIETQDGSFISLTKGAPAVVLSQCSWYVDEEGSNREMTPEAGARFLKINERMAADGLRVLAFAEKIFGSDDASHEPSGYTFLGLVGMTDPPRREVPDAIRRAREAGIRVVMLTGDQMLTAQAIASELDISEDHNVVALHSSDLSDADDVRLAELAKSAHVFARVTPEDKFRIVRALQAAGEIVAVTGDGVNDAPALKQADIGIAMGSRGTDVAKEAADIVLTDDNFSTIIRAVEGGRTIYANIIKFVHLMFSHNLGEVLTIFVAIVSGLPLPLLPLQILWINLVTDIFPAFALAVEPSTKETMQHRPRSPSDAFLSAKFMFLIGWQGAMLAAITLTGYIWALNEYGEGSHARTVSLFLFVGVQVGHLFNCRSRSRSAFDEFFSNPFIFVSVAIVTTLQLFALYNPFLSKILDLHALDIRDTAVIVSATILPVLIVEIGKAVNRRQRR